MSAAQRLDDFQRRHPQAGFPIAVLYKFFDDQGSYLAALITYYGFLSLFPLLLLLSSALGFLLQHDPHLQQQVLNSALRQFPVIGRQLGDPGGLKGSGAALAIGIAGTVYGGLGVAQAVQNAMNVAWAIPRNSRPNPLRARGLSILLIGTVGLAVLGTTVLSAIGSRTSAFGYGLGVGARAGILAVSVAVNAVFFVVGFRIATARPLTRREVAPGAIAAAVVWQLLQTFGAAYVSGVVTKASATNSVFALVLGLIAFIYLEAVAVVLCVEINVVRVRHLYPRALLTPFTDDVDLTASDKRAYTSQAEAQRAKGFETVTVEFDETADPPR